MLASKLHANLIASLPISKRAQILLNLTQEQCTSLLYDWRFWARDEQVAPLGEWRVWLYLGGRGAGKTRSGAEWVREQVAAGRKRIALVAPTAADTRDVIVEGESGILAISPPDNRPHFEPSKRRLTWRNGAMATLYSADEPERLRGPQHDAAWCDEIAAWRYPETWDMLMFGLRLGNDPRVVVTTTPRPVDLLSGNGQNGRRLGLLRDSTCIVTRGSSYRNRANLAPAFFSQVVRRYEGTRLGRQELEAELLEDVPGALWSREMIEVCRITPKLHMRADEAGIFPAKQQPEIELTRIVVAIDPAVTSGEDADETGIVVAGKDAQGRGYVLDDVSGRYTPAEWAQKAIGAYRFHRADRIVAEVNQGGELVEATLRMVDENVPYEAVRAPATRSKVTRAEPVAALYEQGRVHHVGAFPVLEDQMCAFTSDFDRKAAGYSPDRVDALVWAVSELLVEQMAGEGVYQFYRAAANSGAAPSASIVERVVGR
jgi:phage terminase large subunit-like protein